MHGKSFIGKVALGELSFHKKLLKSIHSLSWYRTFSLKIFHAWKKASCGTGPNKWCKLGWTRLQIIKVYRMGNYIEWVMLILIFYMVVCHIGLDSAFNFIWDNLVECTQNSKIKNSVNTKFCSELSIRMARQDHKEQHIQFLDVH